MPGLPKIMKTKGDRCCQYSFAVVMFIIAIVTTALCMKARDTDHWYHLSEDGKGTDPATCKSGGKEVEILNSKFNPLGGRPRLEIYSKVSGSDGVTASIVDLNMKTTVSPTTGVFSLGCDGTNQGTNTNKDMFELTEGLPFDNKIGCCRIREVATESTQAAVYISFMSMLSAVMQIHLPGNSFWAYAQIFNSFAGMVTEGSASGAAAQFITEDGDPECFAYGAKKSSTDSCLLDCGTDPKYEKCDKYFMLPKTFKDAWTAGPGALCSGFGTFLFCCLFIMSILEILFRHGRMGRFLLCPCFRGCCESAGGRSWGGDNQQGQQGEYDNSYAVNANAAPAASDGGPPGSW